MTGTGHHSRLLNEERLMRIFGEFSNWRIDDFIRQLATQRKRGGVLPFVRGLRLSAQLIYAIREILSGTNLTASWGHLLDKDGTFCSSECDVIIHQEGHVRQWNGENQNPIMDFKFIEQEKAVAVISCKSYLRSYDIDQQYCDSMKPFVKNIWLFAECCGPRSNESILKKALEYGYERFWFLYCWSRKSDPQPNSEGWSEFVEVVKKLSN